MKTIEKDKSDKTLKDNKNINKYFKQIKKALTPQFITRTTVLLVLGVIICTIFCISNIREMSGLNETFSKLTFENNIGTFVDLMKYKLIMMCLIIASGVVPFCYLSYIGYLIYIYVESGELAYCIVSNGAIGIVQYMFPLIMNLTVISIITSIGVQLCQRTTAKYKLNRMNSTNITTLKMKYYELTKNEEKLKQLTEKKDENTNKLEKQISKTNYRLLFVVLLMLILVQVISVVVTQWSF